MSKYNKFLTFFIIACVFLIFFMIFYIKGIISFILYMYEHEDSTLTPFEILNSIFTLKVIISGLLYGFAILICRIMGIIYVSKNRNVGNGERTLWIIGFIMMGFVSSVVFLFMAKSRKYVE